MMYQQPIQQPPADMMYQQPIQQPPNMMYQQPLQQPPTDMMYQQPYFRGGNNFGNIIKVRLTFKKEFKFKLLFLKKMRYAQ